MPKGVPDKRYTPEFKKLVVQKLRQRHSPEVFLSIAQPPRATFYYHLKRMNCADKYESAKEEITAIYHENKGRYGYRRIMTELRSRDLPLNHKTGHRLMYEGVGTCLPCPNEEVSFLQGRNR